MKSNIKKAVDALSRRDYPRTAKKLLQNPSIAKEIKKQLCATIRKECKNVCNPDKESVLRCPDNSKLLKYESETIIDELKNNLPTTFDCLQAIVGKDASKSGTKSKKAMTLTLAYSALMRSRNSNMSRIPKILGILMYNGKCNTKVLFKT